MAYQFPEKQYDTLGNGGLMYRVFDNGKVLRVITPEPLPNNNINEDYEEEPELMDWIDDRPSHFKKSEIRIPYTRVWVAKDANYTDGEGFELIAEIECYENICCYVFIGPQIIFFWTNQPIEIYHGYVGNSGVPYSFAATKDYAYWVVGEGVRVASRKLLEKHLGKPLSTNMTQNDIYDVTYDMMDIPYTSVKQEKLHDNYNADEFEPFDQEKFQELMQRATIQQRKGIFSNTATVLGSKLPMNLARHIATYRTGLAYRPYKKNTIRNNANVMGPLSNNFHTGNNSRNSRNSRNNVATVSTRRCTNGKCAIMGGKRRTYTRRALRRKVRI